MSQQIMEAESKHAQFVVEHDFSLVGLAMLVGGDQLLSRHAATGQACAHMRSRTRTRFILKKQEASRTCPTHAA